LLKSIFDIFLITGGEILEIQYVIITVITVSLITGIIGYLLRKSIAEAKIISAEEQAKKIIEDAEKSSQAKKREILLEAKEESIKLRNEVEKENKERRLELLRTERRLIQKEESLDRKTEVIEKKEEALNIKESEVEKIKLDLKEVYKKQVAELEKISGLSSEEARHILLKDIEKEIQHESAKMIKEIEERAKEEGERKARDIISLAIQRCAADHVAETTVFLVYVGKYLLLIPDMIAHCN
jgi:ribonuclease Y